MVVVAGTNYTRMDTALTSALGTPATTLAANDFDEIVRRHQRRVYRFLFMLLTSFSGAIGAAGAYGATLLFRLAPPIDGFELPHIYLESALLAVGSLAIAGIVSGLYPAARAAVLSPVEALRRE